MINMMMWLLAFAVVITLVYPNKTAFFDRVVLWTGTLWLLVFGAMFLNEIARFAFGGRIVLWANSTWQPFGPMLLGIILLWARWRWKHNDNTAGS